ncbi:alkaline phosphatase, partial [Escherichia coli]
ADETDYVAKFKEAGYAYAATAAELAPAANKADTRKLLGLFALGNMDGVLDRKFLKGGGVAKSPDQPDLTQQVQVALDVLAKNDNGFFLMV